MEDREIKFDRGSFVRKRGGDYSFEGTVVSVFRKRDNKTIRYVVEDSRGILLIMNGNQIEGAS